MLQIYLLARVNVFEKVKYGFNCHALLTYTLKYAPAVTDAHFGGWFSIIYVLSENAKDSQSYIPMKSVTCHFDVRDKYLIPPMADSAT